MKVRSQAIEELGLLNPTELLKVYNLILSLRGTSHGNGQTQKPGTAYLRTRQALKNCKGSLSQDIILEREDRV